MTCSNQHLIFLFVGMFCCGSIATAQQSINASGGIASSSSGTVAYSVGQLFTSFIATESEGSVSVGVQQTYDITTLANTATTFSLPIVLYPNPASHYITIDLQKHFTQDLNYSLFDMKGRLLNRGTITERQQQLPTGNLPPAVYMLRVENLTEQSSKTFKIIKK